MKPQQPPEHHDPSTPLTPLANWSLSECRDEHPALVARVEAILKKYHDDTEWARDKDRLAGRGKYAAIRQRTGIPALKPGQIPRYIGAVARAVATGKLTAAQGNGLLYAAQTMISVTKNTQAPPPPPRSIGFKKASAKS
jgi:hypothetical protein